MLKRYIKDFLTVSMAEIQIGTLPHPTIGVFLVAGNVENLKNYVVLAYIGLYFTLITFACNINCLYDINVDKKYKKYRSEAVERFGKGNLKVVLFIEIMMAISLIMFLYLNGAYYTVLLSMLGLFFCIAYSAPPLRLKGRGFLSSIPVLFGLYTLPLLAGWFLFSNFLEPYFVMFVIGYALMNEGFTLVNTCEDYAEDKEEGIITWAHMLGLKKTLTVAFVFTLCGFLSITSLFFIFMDSFTMLIMLFLGLSILMLLKSSIDVYKTGQGNDLERSAKIYARKMPEWFITTRYPLLFIALSRLF